ncbi:MAG: molybdopterin molybdotransferase MoeA [Hyphomicrobiaceae bacterium]|nr:molybdopterin molybdotransferase MoeA [Hyphomicrobiaceae bacterium]
MAALSVEDALAKVLAGVRPVATEDVDLLDAAGRVLAAEVAALMTQPPFDASAMDGYAVRRADVAQLPVTLRVIGESAAGHGFRGSIREGEAVRIFTGAPVPGGADAIVIQENVETCGDSIRVFDGQPDPAHLRRAGGDFREGDVHLTAGKRLNARDIILAAAMGWSRLPVRRRPKVAILATGDELVPPGETPGPDQIVSSNPFGLAAMLAAAGASPVILGIARDTAESLAEKIAHAADADILLTTGGASVGKHDLVAPALEAAGMTLGFWKIAMRPGKPLIFGQRGEQRIVGLPGNPVSSMICTRVFVVPLIARMLAAADADAPPAAARISAPLEANGPRTHYMRARSLSHDGAMRQVAPLPNQDSSLLTPLAAADCLIVRPARAPALPAGALVEVIDLDF